MRWNKDKSLVLSQICVVIFMVLLAALDIGGYWAVTWFLGFSRALGGLWDGILMLCILYVCSVFGWILLLKLRKLLRNLRQEQVFLPSNVRCLRVSCWCCVVVFVVLVLAGVFYLPFVVIGVAAGFMALIIHIIKNVFEQAIRMKDELDFTI